jgi:hypothetical protein
MKQEQEHKKNFNAEKQSISLIAFKFWRSLSSYQSEMIKPAEAHEQQIGKLLSNDLGSPFSNGQRFLVGLI